MPDTLIGERRYRVVEHTRKQKGKEVVRVQLVSYERQERKAAYRALGIVTGRQKRKWRKTHTSKGNLE